MSKVTKAILGLAGVMSAAWWLGGMMYFIMVAKHFRDEENRENAKDSSTSNTSDRIPSWTKPDNKASAPVEVRHPTRYPSPRPINPSQAIQTFPNQWRTYYNPSGDNRPKRLGDPGWNN